MSKLYKRSDSSYYWWTAVLNGLRLRKSTMMTKKSLALKIKDVWDVKMVLGDMSFIKEEKKELQGIESYIEDYLVFLENRKSENTVLIAKGVEYYLTHVKPGCCRWLFEKESSKAGNTS